MRIFFSGLLSLLPLFDWASDWRFYSKLDSLTYSQPLPIKEFIGDFSGSFDGGDKAFTHNRFEVGVHAGNWRIGWLVGSLECYDYEMSFTKDTALLTYLSENDLPIPRNRAYTLQLETEHSSSGGLPLGYTFTPHKTFNLDINLSLLRGRDFISGSWAVTSYPRSLDINFGEDLDRLLEILSEQLDGNSLEQAQAIIAIEDGNSFKAAIEAARRQAQQIQFRSSID